MLQPCTTRSTAQYNLVASKKWTKQENSFFSSLGDYIFNDGKSKTEESSCDLVTTRGAQSCCAISREKKSFKNVKNGFDP